MQITKTKQEAQTLKYGFMWVETTETYTVNGILTKTVTKKIARDPKVGFFRKLFRV
jgi:hypothetical protein